MIKNLILLSSIVSSVAFAQNKNEIPNFSDGSTVSCTASHNIGNDGQGYTEIKMDVFYRLDSGLYETAYFRKVEKIGNYSFDGSCGKEVCQLFIRDLRTNTVSVMNASYAKLNDNTAQIEIMNFKEDLTINLRCSLIAK